MRTTQAATFTSGTSPPTGQQVSRATASALTSLSTRTLRSSSHLARRVLRVSTAKRWRSTRHDRVYGATFTGTAVYSTQTISFTAPATGSVGGSAPLSATGGASGQPVVFSVDPSTATGICNVSGTDGATVNYTGVGSCIIDANQAAGGGYAAASAVERDHRGERRHPDHLLHRPGHGLGGGLGPVVGHGRGLGPAGGLQRRPLDRHRHLQRVGHRRRHGQLHRRGRLASSTPTRPPAAAMQRPARSAGPSR